MQYNNSQYLLNIGQSKWIKIINKILKNGEIMEEKDPLQIIKERYRDEEVRGDQAKAARIAKVSTPHIPNALAKEKWCDLTGSERKVMLALKKVLDTRKKEEAELLN